MSDLTKKFGVPWEDEPHTPTPWSEFAESGDWWIQQCDTEGNPVGDTVVSDANDMSTADMLFIVQACNAHDALVLALEMAQSDYEASYIALYHSAGDTGQQRIDCQQRIAVINTALAKAHA